MSGRPRFTDTNVWRYKAERQELVELVVEQDREIRRLRLALREYAEQFDEDPSVGAYIALLHARIGVLEQNVDRLIKERGAA